MATDVSTEALDLLYKAVDAAHLVGELTDEEQLTARNAIDDLV